MTLDRRRFLQLSALGVVAGIAESACSFAGRDDAALGRPKLLEMLGPDAVHHIGANYRAATPAENSADALRSAISRGHGFRLPFFGGSLDDQIHDDFAAGRTVTVDGWVLSITEARQCALNSLGHA